jgi:hypothetical protein
MIQRIFLIWVGWRETPPPQKEMQYGGPLNGNLKSNNSICPHQLHLTPVVTCISDLYAGFWSVNRFIGYSQVVSTSNYNTPRITVNIIQKKIILRRMLTSRYLVKFQLLNPPISILNPLGLWLSLWLSESRSELISCRSNIEHPVGELIPLLFSVATKRVTISGATRWFIQAHSLPRKCVSTSRYPAKDVSDLLFWLHTSSFQASCHNI